jgi:hypothetical protein
MMDPKLVQSISNRVYKKFPEIAGKKPQVRKQRTNGSLAKSAKPSANYLLTFRGIGKGPGGRKIPRLVRVVANTRGKILKISTSRG